MFKYILFDLDGTLTDSSEGITKSVQFALSQKGIVEPDLTKLYCFLGPPLTYSFSKYYNFSEEQTTDAIRDFRKRYDPIGVYENKLYPGMEALLSELHNSGVKLLVASSKPEYLVYRVLSHFNVKDYFDVIAGSPRDERNYSKEDVMETALWELMDLIDGKPVSNDAPKEEFVPSELRDRGSLEEALDSHNINKKTCAMVGDRHFDINAANNYGLCSIGVRFGFAEKGELEEAGADIIAKDTKELLEILKGEGSQSKKKLTPWGNRDKKSAGSFSEGTASNKGALYQKGSASGKIPYLRICLLAFSAAYAFNIFFNITGFVRVSQTFSEVSDAQMSVPIGFGIVFYALLVPVLEESIFRWLIFGRLRKIIPASAAMILSSALFGAYHGNIVQGVYAFLMGMLFCYVYHKTGKIRTAFLMHGVANAAVFLGVSGVGVFEAVNTPIHCLIFAFIALTSLRNIAKESPSF